jgi:hypothetical protein
VTSVRSGRRVGRHQHVQFAEPISDGPAIEDHDDLARVGVNILDVADITIVPSLTGPSPELKRSTQAHSGL